MTNNTCFQQFLITRPLLWMPNLPPKSPDLAEGSHQERWQPEVPKEQRPLRIVEFRRTLGENYAASLWNFQAPFSCAMQRRRLAPPGTKGPLSAVRTNSLCLTVPGEFEAFGLTTQLVNIRRRLGSNCCCWRLSQHCFQAGVCHCCPSCD